ncbi:methyltransferase [Candidatus Thiodictyon syntrophicum]|jgi:demethylspheroidene O-methyltransferase|uniref:Methyltransferase n=2 Tax=Candidatus Thiodictyon syntrophicum TaxID=1166950 RepID=A0A2K8UIQ1_9GAMM|nr:CrtF [Candidatus Thiodictyon syntrophicum str. Cad16]AUB85359.1 methyltransferase [Candidatus Thiodictyon syntrophicum]
MDPMQYIEPAVVPGGWVAGWHRRWLDLRNRLLASSRFQRWVAGFPLTRPLARRRARHLFDLCAGFVYSQILFACIELDLFDLLAEGPLSVCDLAGRLGLPEPATRRLLKSAESLELVERTAADHYALGELGAALRGNPGIVEMVRHHAMLYRDLADPVGLLRDRRSTHLGAYWAYADSAAPECLETGSTRDYTALMSDSQGLVSSDILDSYSMERHRRLLDLGGGNGTFLAAVAARWPHLDLRLFDLPAVVEQARERLAREGLAARTQAIGGDLFRDTLPSGADLITLVRVVHDHDDGPVMGLLRAARQALPDDGTLLLAEPMAGTPGAEPIGEAYFGFYLWAMGSGRPRTCQELTAMLHQAGFSSVREVSTRRPLLMRLLVARA